MENEKNRYIALRFFPWWDFFGNVSLSKLIWKSVSYHRGSKWLRPALPRRPFHFLQCQKFWNESTGVLSLRVNNKSRLWVIMGQSLLTSGLLLPLRWILTVACFTGLICKQGKTSSINGVLTHGQQGGTKRRKCTYRFAGSAAPLESLLRLLCRTPLWINNKLH